MKLTRLRSINKTKKVIGLRLCEALPNRTDLIRLKTQHYGTHLTNLFGLLGDFRNTYHTVESATYS